jgi:hypothetical protein
MRKLHRPAQSKEPIRSLKGNLVMESQQQFVLPIVEPLKPAALLAVLHSSTAHLPAALAAAQRISVRDGLGYLSEDDLRRAILYLRSFATNELARMSGAPSNVVNADVIGGQR